MDNEMLLANATRSSAIIPDGMSFAVGYPTAVVFVKLLHMLREQRLSGGDNDVLSITFSDVAHKLKMSESTTRTRIHRLGQHGWLNVSTSRDGTSITFNGEKALDDIQDAAAKMPDPDRCPELEEEESWGCL